MVQISTDTSKAQISRSSIQRLQISMRHLFIRGGYKPLGISGEAMIQSLLALEPEIYGTIGDEEKVELNGLHYIFLRLPQGIEQCRYIKLISREGFETTHFDPLVPSKRRRNCYRIDKEQMFIEMTRGRSDIYDVLTHLTFMYIEAEKIRRNALDTKNRKNRSWLMLEKMVQKIQKGEDFDQEVGYTYLSTLLGRTYAETAIISKRFDNSEKVNHFIEIIYWMGRLAIEEYLEDIDREITFSSELREKIGHHFFGEMWANQIKEYMDNQGWHNRPIHVVSANLHSVMNSLYAHAALGKSLKSVRLEDTAEVLSQDSHHDMQIKVKNYALKNGMHELSDNNGTNITVQLFDCKEIDDKLLPKELRWKKTEERSCPLIMVMDYAFGEQAYETMDELLKPYGNGENRQKINIASVNVMGKAGILTGKKGDIMIPTAHIFEGSADNYPFENHLNAEDFQDSELEVFTGPMITVMGTSLQNKDILRYFHHSSWKVIGLEMEGAHYQKAIQAASKIRKGVREDLVLRYAYYASDNPLVTGSTLASGSLGLEGVKPTYLITINILNGIFAQKKG